jgi:hypothetical protein
VAFEVVDGEQRPVAGHRQRLGGDQPDHHSADQAGPGRGGDGGAFGQRHAGLREHALDQRREPLGVGARGDLRDHAAVRRVAVVLRGDRLRENLAIIRHQRRGGFVAAAFDAEHDPHPALPLDAIGN